MDEFYYIGFDNILWAFKARDHHFQDLIDGFWRVRQKLPNLGSNRVEDIDSMIVGSDDGRLAPKKT